MNDSWLPLLGTEILEGPGLIQRAAPVESLPVLPGWRRPVAPSFNSSTEGGLRAESPGLHILVTKQN
jgi:hypothetical protein